MLGSYPFWFKTAANKAIFDKDPWSYAPAWGGFCAWGVAGEYPSHASATAPLWMPSDNVEAAS